MESKASTLIVSLLLTFCASVAEAKIQLVDLAGREVVLEQPAKKIILGEGRFIAALGALGVERPVDLLVGMMNEFRLYDPLGYAQYQAAYPEIDQVENFGHTSESSVSIEKILTLKPELAIFGLEGHGPSARSAHIISTMEKAGITIVFIDFRGDPIGNTPKSMKLIAEALGIPEKGQAFVDFYEAELRKVTAVVAEINPNDFPSVLFELRAGRSQECCLTVAKGMFADMAEAAGGKSFSADLLPGPVGTLNYEKVITSSFDFYVGTAVGSPPADGAQYDYLVTGPGVSQAIASESLEVLLSERRMLDMPFAKAGNAHVLWHHFYNSPLNIYVIQQMAKWFHPDLFQDLNPEDTLNYLLDRARPVELRGTYGASLKEQN